MMFRWVMFAILVVLFLSWLFSKRLPWLEKMGLTKFSSSVNFNFLGRPFRLPVTLVAVFGAMLVVLVQWVHQWYFE